jgi:prepilin-type processing-associated H-X9-DG protein
MNSRNQRRRGLSLLEGLFVIATLFLLASFLLPALSRPKRSSRIGCTSQLKQVGLAYRIYSNDHGDQYPFAVSNELGGSLSFTNTPQVFRHFEVLSNELVTPKVLVCPVDRSRIRGASFQTPLSNLNISYFVGFEASEDQPQSILSGDRNITGGNLTNGFLRLVSKNDQMGWTKDLHNGQGNIGLGDGSVQQVTTGSLIKQVQAQPLPVIRLAIP